MKLTFDLSKSRGSFHKMTYFLSFLDNWARPRNKTWLVMTHVCLWSHISWIYWWQSKAWFLWLNHFAFVLVNILNFLVIRRQIGVLRQVWFWVFVHIILRIKSYTARMIAHQIPSTTLPLIVTEKLLLGFVQTKFLLIRFNDMVIISIPEAYLTESSRFTELMSLFGLRSIEWCFENVLNVYFWHW